MKIRRKQVKPRVRAKMLRKEKTLFFLRLRPMILRDKANMGISRTINPSRRWGIALKSWPQYQSRAL
jgi:hypothetical protein